MVYILFPYPTPFGGKFEAGNNMAQTPKKVNWKVEGMTCSNCALTIQQYLKGKGMNDVKVDLLQGDVSFDLIENNNEQNIKKGIEDLGYSIQHDHHDHGAPVKRKWLRNHKQRFLFCLIFTLPLMMHMFDNWWHIHWLMDPWVQLALCLPVYIVGMDFFGRSALKSLRNRMPNMNVLVALGATAAFVYSLTGALMNMGGQYLFFETTASIITLVFLGNYLEDASIHSTQRALNKLARSQKVMANMLAFDGEGKEVILPVENTTLQEGDFVLIKSGEQVPADCKILWGDATVNESIITGESLPVNKKAKDKIIGGSLLVDGTLRAQVTSEAKDSYMEIGRASCRERV